MLNRLNRRQYIVRANETATWREGLNPRLPFLSFLHFFWFQSGIRQFKPLDTLDAGMILLVCWLNSSSPNARMKQNKD